MGEACTVPEEPAGARAAAFAGTAAPLAPVGPGVGAPHGLRLPSSALVGRRRELAEIGRLLGESRLVTLTGDPGIGKSRLALEAISRDLPGHTDAAHLVGLSHLDDERLLPGALTFALGVGRHPARGLVDGLQAYLQEGRVLLVLDHCEHVRDACGGLAATLLAACPQLTVLVTSREPLAVPGERVWRVAPLGPPASGDDRLEALEASDAVALFCRRAGVEAGAFALALETAPDVAEICRGLDGNPLAIELAAARVGTLTPSQIVEGLRQRPRLLTGGRSAGLGRRSSLPRSLEAAIAWSYELLADPQKVLLRRLSALAGGITLEGAREVCAGEGLTGDDIPQLLAALVEGSLVGVEVAGRRARYRLPEAIRQFAAGLLEEAGEAGGLRARLEAWCLALAERADVELAGPSHHDWLGCLEVERHNVEATIERSLAEGRAEPALRVAGAMAHFWRLRGHLGEGVALLERCLAAAPEADPLARAKASWGSGLLAADLGDLPSARSRGEESLRLAGRAHDPAAGARALELMGFATMHGDDPSEAVGLLERSVALARRAGDARCLAAALDRRGEVHVLQGDPRGALALFEECFAVARAAGDRQAQARGLLGQGWAAIDLGDYEVAEARIRLAEDLARSLGDRLAIGESVFFLGQLARLRGDLDQAEGLLGQCRELAQAMQAPLLEVRALAGLAAAEMARGRYEPARERFGQAIAIARKVGLAYVLRQSLLGLSACATAMGDRGSAEQALREALRSARRHGDRQGTSIALYALATLARERGAPQRAARMHAEALRLHAETGDPEAIARSLEGLAGAALDREQFVFAARLLGAAEARWKRLGRYRARWPWEQEGHDRDLARLEGQLGPEALREAWEEGAARPLEDLIAYALRGRAGRREATAAPATLTGSELAVARLAARGLTSREVAERLIISPRTVEAHLANAYRKLGIRSRRELRELAERLPELGGPGA